MRIPNTVEYLALVIISLGRIAAAQDLQQRLMAEPPEALAKRARDEGDAQRGAILFHQPHLACSKCHDTDSEESEAAKSALLGPDLTPDDDDLSDEHLIESILSPSKVIKKGFETITIELSDGRTIVGMLAKESGDSVVLMTADGSAATIPKGKIERRQSSATSTMPADLANQLTSRQQFLDLVRYLVEIRTGGRQRARELRPPPSLLVLQLPDYESRVDHAGLIRALDEKAFDRGQTIYERLCVNCHGTHEQPGSLPTSRRLAAEQFKNGSDPFAMYQTLTRGFGLMPPQTWMVPQEKYDVVHYIREAYLRRHNPSQYEKLTEDYLNRLPKGDTRGPTPRKIEPWATMDYGPSLINTYEFGSGGDNIAQKGIAVRLDPGPGGISRGKAWMVFDHDTLRMAGAWTGTGFIDWHGIHFDGRHQVHPRVVGDIAASNPTGPGWADPATGRFDDDRRIVGRDGRRYGPLPRDWGRYRGLYHNGDDVVISYTIATTEVLETPSVVFVPPTPTAATGELQNPATKSSGEEPAVFTRSFYIGRRDKPLKLLVATHSAKYARLEPMETPRLADDGPENKELSIVRFGTEWENPRSKEPSVLAGLVGPAQGCTWESVGNRLCLNISAGREPLRFTTWFTRETAGRPLETLVASIPTKIPQPNLTTRVAGGPPRWPQVLTTEASLGASDGPFAIDVLTHPHSNPWLAQMRFTGIDFYPDGDRAVVCAWDGDVWLVRGLSKLDAVVTGGEKSSKPQLTWQRIASGLFQPLGIKVVNDRIFVTCRDQLVVLRDLNADGETDFYECFSNDHQVTEHFHEFAMGLQVDFAGNFYYAKSARHALPAVVPHHGTLLRVTEDGGKTEILATGFRAANGVCLNDDGTYFVTDQEGHWTPKNRINFVKDGGFYGNMFGYHDVKDSSDAAMEQPICWITNEFDRSPAELLWAPRNAWGPLSGSLLNLSYGYGKLFVVPFEEIDGQKQGGMCALPIPPLPTGVMRGRFHPRDGQLYCCGMFAWAGSATQPGGLYRIRYTKQPMWLPTRLEARRGRLDITFTDPLDRQAASNPANYSIKTWSLKRSAEYGSKHFDEKSLALAAEVSDDGLIVSLKPADLGPTWGMEIVCRLKGEDGKPFERVIQNSVFKLGD